MKKTLSVISVILFAALYLLGSVSSSYSVKNFYFGFHSFSFIYIRYVIIFLLMICLVYLNRKNEKLLTVFVPAAMVIIAAGAYTEYFFTQKLLYNYGYLLWFGVVYSITNAGVFIGATAFSKDYFKTFYSRFWKAYIPIYILIIYVAFIRQPESYGLTINTVFGNGTLKYFKALIKAPADNLYTSLICFGNIFILLPLPFILSSIKRLPVPIVVIIGLIIPFIFEGYQYIFKCGNVDIDDIVLNVAGYLAGFFINEYIYKKEIITDNSAEKRNDNGII